MLKQLNTPCMNTGQWTLFRCYLSCIYIIYRPIWVVELSSLRMTIRNWTYNITEREGSVIILKKVNLFINTSARMLLYRILFRWVTILDSCIYFIFSVKPLVCVRAFTKCYVTKIDLVRTPNLGKRFSSLLALSMLTHLRSCTYTGPCTLYTSCTQVHHIYIWFIKIKNQQAFLWYQMIHILNALVILNWAKLLYRIGANVWIKIHTF
jgi:hypothetical protein